jgi:hypothetical protein
LQWPDAIDPHYLQPALDVEVVQILLSPTNAGIVDQDIDRLARQALCQVCDLAIVGDIELERFHGTAKP